MAKHLALAALSARMMVEAAERDGYGSLALDVFGDSDTRSKALHWQSIGSARELCIDGGMLLAALERLASRDDVLGWVAGSGFEAHPQWLEEGARRLPLLGTPADEVRRVRDPHTFFGWLDAQDVAHPEVSRQAPQDPVGWLVKRADSAGGWHIRRVEDVSIDARFLGNEADAVHAATPTYFQREASGRPMSALFVGNGQRAHVFGFNELIVRRFGRHPHVYCGAIGPVPVAPAIASALQRLLDALVAEFGLKGLCSLDFLLDGPRVSVLELNPRPSASMALYGDHNVMRSHVLACTQLALPPPRGAGPARPVQGTEIVFAPWPTCASEEAAAWLACQRDVHDLPAAGAVFAAGDPVCSVAAQGRDAHEVRERLERRRLAVHQMLESRHERVAAVTAG